MCRRLLGECSQEQQLQDEGNQDWQREKIKAIAIAVEASAKPRVALRLEWSFRDDPNRDRRLFVCAPSEPVVGCSPKEGENLG